MRNGVCWALALICGAGCTTPSAGENDKVGFVPMNCGYWLEGCTFEDGIGTGGRIAVQIDGLDGFSTAGVEVASGDEDRMTVEPTADIGGSPAWEITAVASGTVRLLAVSDGDVEEDFIEITIADVEALTLAHLAGEAVGPSSDEAADEGWSLNADQDVTFQLTPLVGEDRTMGRFTYLADAASVEDGALEHHAPDEGHLAFRLPEGAYAVAFVSETDPDVALSAAFHVVAPL